jgi:benzodiazapine receptor
MTSSILGVVPLIGGTLVGFISSKNAYKTLQKPSWSPPSYAFGIVWPILYILMGISLVIVTNSDHPLKNWAIFLFFTQLLVNFSWTPIFFNLKQMQLALYVILLLDILVACTIILFASISKTAAMLLVPYLGWILFATMLTKSIVSQNT